MENTELVEKILENDKSGHNIEIEVRMGLLCLKDYNDQSPMERSTPSDSTSKDVWIDKENFFVPGVSPTDYETIKKEIERVYLSPGSATKDTVYNYGGPMKDYREVFPKELPYKEKKTKGHSIDIQIPSASYDLRFHTSMEYRDPDPIIGENPKRGWTMERTRRRISWESPTDDWDNTDWMWKMDLTMVEARNTKESLDPSWEVELELKESVVKKWLDISDESEVMKMTSQISSHLINLINKINPRETEDPSGKDLVEISNNDPLNRTVNRKLREIHYEFPGAQPVNMRRKHIPMIQNSVHDYYVAEKSDGVRHLMVCTNGECILVDRSEKLFHVKGGRFLYSLLGEGTILDGELIYDRVTKESIFVAFDILFHGKTDVRSNSFLSRQNSLRNVIGHLKGRGGDHLLLDMKTFYPRRKIMDLFRHIRVEGRHRVFKNNKTDGIIFQPNLPYKMGKDDNLLKWKWGDLASIDLSVKIDENEMKLCSYNKNEDVDLSMNIQFSVQDKARLLADARQEGLNIEKRRKEEEKRGKEQGGKGKKRKEIYPIAEIALDPGSGLWVFMGIRKDKDRSNYIGVVMSTMIEVAEGISEEEIKYRMMLESSVEDDWVRQESNLKKRAVQYGCEKSNKKIKN